MNAYREERPEGRVGLCLDLGEIEWEEVNELRMHSYYLVAPRRLANGSPDWREITSREILLAQGAENGVIAVNLLPDAFG